MTLPGDPKIVEQLRAATRHTGTGPLGGFAYDLDLSVPFVVTAIHAGHRVRDELLPLMAIDEEERRFEEDAATDRIVQGCPSAVWGLDSRSEYDINRPPEIALPLTPEMFWGTRVYTFPPTDAMNRRSLGKYEDFYRFFASLVQILLERFGCCAVYDIHSYNISRQAAKGHMFPPVFNLGTAEIDPDRWRPSVDDWLEVLGGVMVPGKTVVVAENLVFEGKGAFCRRLNQWSDNILVLPTEISKVYMDEHTGRVDDRVTAALAEGLAAAVHDHGRRFQERYCRKED